MNEEQLIKLAGVAGWDCNGIGSLTGRKRLISKDGKRGMYRQHWQPHTDISQAFEILHAMVKDDDCLVCSYSVVTETDMSQYRCHLYMDYDCIRLVQSCTEISDANAICIAILLYLNEYGEEEDE